ncbi:MAG: hypothetical protein ACOX7B_03320 [Christensenellales bacterium]|jgi:hypothetical protein
MKVRAIKLFMDKQGKCLRYPGSEFEASEERVAAINSTKAGQLVEVIQEPEPDKPEDPATAATEEPEKEQKPKATKAKQ